MEVSGAELNTGMALGSDRACTFKGLLWDLLIGDM